MYPAIHHQIVAAGVEEEFQTVDLATRRLTAQADMLIERLPAGSFSLELQRSVLEANSRPGVSLTDLAEDIAALRQAAIAAAGSFGLGTVAAGTVPLADPDTLQITPDPRYERIQGEYRMLVREQLICGTQVHVDVADRDLAVAVARRVTPGMIYFDVRPSAHLPSLELRICDSCPRLEDVVLLAGLFRALVTRETAAAIAGRPPVPVRPELLQAATWRAAQSGLEGNLVDPVTAASVPARRLIGQLLAELRPALESAGD